MSKPGPSPKGDYVTANAALEGLSSEADLAKDEEYDLEGLTERQQLIFRFRLRGLSQQAIAKFFKVSQPVISKEVKRIKQYFRDKGSSIDQDATIGETTSLYEEVEAKSWEMYHKTEDESIQAKALGLVMQARDKHTKLLMDLGKLTKASNRVEVVEVSPFIASLKESDRKAIVAAALKTQLDELPAPEPPKLSSENEDIEDAELVED